jgi:hypothetical protein
VVLSAVEQLVAAVSQRGRRANAMFAAKNSKLAPLIYADDYVKTNPA